MYFIAVHHIVEESNDKNKLFLKKMKSQSTVNYLLQMFFLNRIVKR